jgi:uncharacterized integral membrane protein
MIMKIVLAAFTGLILLMLAIIGVQNPTLISIRFLGWQTGVLPLWVIMVASLAVGMLLVSIITLPGRIGRYRTTRRLRSQLAAAEVVAPATQSIPAAPPADHIPPLSNPGRMEHTP